MTSLLSRLVDQHHDCNTETVHQRACEDSESHNGPDAQYSLLSRAVWLFERRREWERLAGARLEYRLRLDGKEQSTWTN